MKIRKPDENDIVIFIYIAFVILITVLGLLAMIWSIVGAFKILTSDLPFWMKWALLTRGGH